MKFGLSDDQIRQVQAILSKYPAITEAVVFGSRAMGNYKEASDVDVALKGDITLSMVADVKYVLEEDTYLPFFFDIIAYGIIDAPKLKEHIDKYGEVLYRAGWKECRVGDCVLINSRNVDKNYPHTEIEYLDTGSITQGKIESLQHFQLADAPSRAKRIVKNNDIVVSMVRPIQRHYGFLRNVPENMVASTGFVVLTCKDDIEPYFLYSFLTQQDTTEHLDMIAEGATSTYPAFTPEAVENLSINLPSLTEQRAIAAVLSSLDAKIDLLHLQNKTLEGLASALWRKMFIEEADPEWEEGILRDYVEVVDNRGKTPPFIETKTDYPIIEVNALTGTQRLINYAVIKKYVTGETYNSWFRAGHPKINDILISTVGSVGEIAMFLIDKGTIAQNVVALRATKTSPFYLYQYLKHFQDDIKAYDIGSVQPSIKVTHFIKTKYIQPPNEKLKAFDAVMRPIIDKLVANHTQAHTASSLRDELLPKLMSGEVRVEG